MYVYYNSYDKFQKHESNDNNTFIINDNNDTRKTSREQNNLKMYRSYLVNYFQ